MRPTIVKPVGGVAFSPDGKLFATGGFDATLRVWNAADGQLLTIDPYGDLSICVLSHFDRYNVRDGSVKEGWEQFLYKVRGKRITSDILRFTQPAGLSRARVDVTEWLSAVSLEAHSLLPPNCTLDVVSEEEIALIVDQARHQEPAVDNGRGARHRLPLRVGAGRQALRFREPGGRE